MDGFCFTGVHYVFDTSFSRTFSLLESQREFVERFQRKGQDSKALPMLTSACPGMSVQPLEVVVVYKNTQPLIVENIDRNFPT